MDKPKMTYFEKEDILHLVISDESESDSIELNPNIAVELNNNAGLLSFLFLTKF